MRGAEAGLAPDPRRPIDVTAHRLAHQSMLVALAGLCGLLALLGTRRSARLVARMAWPWAPLAAAFWAAVMVVLRLMDVPHGFESLDVEPHDPLGFVLGGLLAIALGLVGRGRRSRRTDRACLLLTLALLVALLAPALRDHLDFSRQPWSMIEQLQADYEFTIGTADRLLAGDAIGDHLVPFYGLVPPVVLAGIQRQLGPWTLGDYIRFMQAMQLLLFALLIPSYAVYTHGRWLLGLLAMAFVAVDFHFGTYLLTMPNLMGWRFLAFPVAFLGVLAAHRMTPVPGAASLGAIAGFSMLYSIDSGIAVTAGLGLCAFLRFTGQGDLSWSRGLASGAAFLGGSLVAYAAFHGIHRVSLGYWMGWDAPIGVISHLILRAGGYGGHAASFDPMVVVAFGHAAAVLVHAWLERSFRLSTRRAMRALAAAIVLVWFAYYVQRPNASCFTSFLIPYSFLLLDTLRAVTLASRGRRLGRWRLGLALATLVLVVAPFALTTARIQVPGYLRALEQVGAHAPLQARVVQGISVPDDDRSRRILAQSEYLRRHPAEEPLFYFTVDNYLVSRQAGVWPEVPLPMANAFLGSQTREHFRALLRAVEDPSVERVYFDSWHGLSEAEADANWQTRAFYRHLRLRLHRTFPERRIVSGWEEWTREEAPADQQRQAGGEAEGNDRRESGPVHSRRSHRGPGS